MGYRLDLKEILIQFILEFVDNTFFDTCTVKEVMRNELERVLTPDVFDVLEASGANRALFTAKVNEAWDEALELKTRQNPTLEDYYGNLSDTEAVKEFTQNFERMWDTDYDYQTVGKPVPQLAREVLLKDLKAIYRAENRDLENALTHEQTSGTVSRAAGRVYDLWHNQA